MAKKKSTVYGSVCFVLHSHLPYVISHGNWPHGMDWINEAAAETYIPLISTFLRLIKEGHSPKVTVGITPVLAEQLTSASFKKEFVNYLNIKENLAVENFKEFSKLKETELANLSLFWKGFYKNILNQFQDKYNGDLISIFRKLQEEEHIEIITSAATHAYLPLLSLDTSIQAQIKQGVETHKRHFGSNPRGIWLPECAYRPRYMWRKPIGVKKGRGHYRWGIEEFLSENQIDYFIIDTHLLKGGKAIGVYLERFEALRTLWQRFAKSYKPRREIEKSPYDAYLVGSEEITNKKPVAIFARDPFTGLQVWSGEYGYPGDGWYLDFHKKHFPGGHRYWRVTHSKSDLAEKKIYQPQRAASRLPKHAKHFKYLAINLLKEHFHKTKRLGVLCAPYDAELFGHWWFEGPEWLYFVIKEIQKDNNIKLSTCSEHLQEQIPESVVSLPEGSWGEGGFHWIWLNQLTEWTWKHIYEVEEDIKRLAKSHHRTNDQTVQELLKQAMREVFLLQASDWQFLISTWTAKDYAEVRLLEHYENFKRIKKILQRYVKDKGLKEEDRSFLKLCRQRDNVFPDANPEWFVEF